MMTDTTLDSKSLTTFLTMVGVPIGQLYLYLLPIEYVKPFPELNGGNEHRVDVLSPLSIYE